MSRAALRNLHRRLIRRLDAGAEADELLDECVALLQDAWKATGMARRALKGPVR